MIQIIKNGQIFELFSNVHKWKSAWVMNPKDKIEMKISWVEPKPRDEMISEEV